MRETFGEKNRIGIYCALQTFFAGEPFGVRRRLLKNPLAVIYCDCFHTFVEGENFFGKDTGKFFAKILSELSNVCNAYKKLTGGMSNVQRSIYGLSYIFQFCR